MNFIFFGKNSKLAKNMMLNTMMVERSAKTQDKNKESQKGNETR